MKPSRKGLVLAALPGITALLLFYSLAIHMHQSLGGWPTSIGERGFSRPLVIHSLLTVDMFSAVTLTLFLLPIPMLVCLVVERWQRFVPYFAICAGAILLCFLLTQFAAPVPFLDWWRD
jgi:hypothetical protein